MPWTAGDSVALGGPLMAAALTGLAVAVRAGIRGILRRIDEGETRLDERLGRQALQVDAQGLRLDDHGERLAWIQGSLGLPLRMPTSPTRAIREAVAKAEADHAAERDLASPEASGV